MLVSEALRIIHLKYEFNTFYPEDFSEDYELRLALINDKINMWENEDGILWRELYTRVSDRFDDDATYTITDMKVPANKLLSNSCYYEYYSPELIQEQSINDPEAKVFSITGGDVEKTINAKPELANEVFEFYYYKKARTFLLGTENAPEGLIEMSDPYFVIYSVVSELFLDDGDTEKAGVAIQVATQKLEAMKTRNAIVPVFGKIKQQDYTFKGFGN
jgi:hypothetical protein